MRLFINAVFHSTFYCSGTRESISYCSNISLISDTATSPIFTSAFGFIIVNNVVQKSFIKMFFTELPMCNKNNYLR